MLVTKLIFVGYVLKITATAVAVILARWSNSVGACGDEFAQLGDGLIGVDAEMNLFSG